MFNGGCGFSQTDRDCSVFTVAQALVLMRRGIASLALASAISRGDDLVVAISFSRWRCLSHNAVC
jgi:hypothetical protein